MYRSIGKHNAKLCSFTLNGIIDAVKLGAIKPKDAYDVIQKNNLGLDNLELKVVPGLEVFTRLIHVENRRKWIEVIEAFMKEYPEEFFERVLSISEKYPLVNRIYSATINMMMENMAEPPRYNKPPIP